MFTTVSATEWGLFFLGAGAGTILWIWVYRHIVRVITVMLCRMVKQEIWGILVQTLVGAALILPNVILVNLGETLRNFPIAAVGLTGIAFGFWVLIPAEKI